MPELTDLYNPMITQADTTTLRTWAEQHLHRSRYRNAIASIVLSSQVLADSNVLDAMTALLNHLKIAHRQNGAEIEVNHGQAEVTVWADDEELRIALRHAADTARAARERADESTAASANVSS